ncbi:MAG: ATP-binding protein [Alphaproteobacteria bacterium]|nr:ATP-binding protein [Alphaproteobacteria bacterium]
MKLTRFSVSEFRSVWESGPIAVADITCLVGKNEAGKTALLKALYRLNPLVDDDSNFNVTDDYPRKEVSNYEHEVETNQKAPTAPVEATFELEELDVEAVIAVFGRDAIISRSLILFKDYDNKRRFQFVLNEQAARMFLANSADLTDALREQLRAALDWKSFSAALEEAGATAEVTRLRQLVAKFADHCAARYAYNEILGQRVPKFLYFDEYYQMTGHENVQAFLGRLNAKKLLPSDYPLLGLINLARLDINDLLNAKRTLELTNMLEGAGNQLSRQILRYWSQNKHLQMKFDVREAKPEDPPHMRQGVNIWGKIYDSVHWATTELGSRSRGFVWFFSFLAWYEDVKRSRENVVLLLDEPGLSLHGKAQADLLRYFEEQLKPHHQVIYTTHSPFMVDPHHFDRVRIVQDKGIDASEELPREKDGTKVLTEVFDASNDSLFPLQGALGYEIHQTLFVGPNCLVVEGPEDMLFLQSMSSIIEREGGNGLDPRWTITPVGGSGKVPTFVALLAPQTGLRIATLLDIQASDRQTVEGLYKRRLLQRKRMLTYAEFTQTAEADVADMFERDFYLLLVNAEYANVLQRPISAPDLDARIPRVIRAIEAVLSREPLKKGSFGHFRPARYFAEHLADLGPKVSATTKGRFAQAFEKLDAMLA